jgi:hypothetical protein
MMHVNGCGTMRADVVNRRPIERNPLVAAKSYCDVVPAF